MILAAVAFVFASHASAQGRPVLGGYKEVAKTDATAKKAAVFAVGAKKRGPKKGMSLSGVGKAGVKSVAGKNYRRCFKVSDSGAEGQDAAEVFVKAIVNIDLKGVYKLLSWEASDCGEDEGS